MPEGGLAVSRGGCAFRVVATGPGLASEWPCRWTGQADIEEGNGEALTSGELRVLPRENARLPGQKGDSAEGGGFLR